MIRDDFQISWKQIVQNVSLSHICTAELAAKFIATLLFQKKGTKQENNECLICLSVRIITTTDCEEMWLEKEWWVA